MPEDEVEDAWHRVQLVADTVTGAELAQLDDHKLLRRLFAEDDVRMFESVAGVLPLPLLARARREHAARRWAGPRSIR